MAIRGGARFPGADRSFAAFLRALVPWWQILLDLSDTSHDAGFYDDLDEVVRLAPLGDPLDVRVRGYHLSLRRHEARLVAVEPTS